MTSANEVLLFLKREEECSPRGGGLHESRIHIRGYLQMTYRCLQ